jgi:Tol biopolymer transport system component
LGYNVPKALSQLNLKVIEPGDRLDSWKAIAAYLNRSERTVRRWEENEDLPVHRLIHDKRGSVYAYKPELDEWRERRRAIVESDEAQPVNAGLPANSAPNSGRSSWWRTLAWMLTGAFLAAAALGAMWVTSRRQPSVRNVRISRLTDTAGVVKDEPALAPDGKTFAYVSVAEGRRHIWVQQLAAGVPIRITADDTDHEQPRWSPDSSSLIYYSPAQVHDEAGAIWEIPALGGSPRRIAPALGGGDLSHDGQRVALFRSQNGRTELVAAGRRDSTLHHVADVPSADLHQSPRWSPDDRWIAFQSNVGATFDQRIFIVSAQGGVPSPITRADDIRGFSWLNDGSGIIYSSSSGTRVLYPPVFNLWMVRLRDRSDRQLTFGDVSYVRPDLHPSGNLVAGRITSHSDIWSFPVDGNPEDNVRNAIRVTRQTGQIQTPSVSPDGKELVYLSDSGGHGNLWIAKVDGTAARQITFEQDPNVVVGVPVWSPANDDIVFILTREGRASQWLIHSDGTGMRQLVPSGVWAYWSPDGRWLYYVVIRQGVESIEKIPVTGGAAIRVRSDNSVAPAVSNGTLYYATLLKQPGGWSEFEFRRAEPENGDSVVLTHVSGTRVPDEPPDFQMILSPNGNWLVTPLVDGGTTNLWLLPAQGGKMRPITDFGQRPVSIVRRVSWSPDSKRVYAAVAEVEGDIVRLNGLLP